ncbi:hypothetical protein NKI25_02100 [Mesorhizobium sp. M0808]|uniref:hypothetical protein n=1 Tax=Mesorhizobium sp. M0808 TaxID=2957002 RepID=UPI003337CEB8
MRFRLTYEGELKAGQKDPDDNQWDRMAEHKQAIRKVFHRQLKHLWETNRFLREHEVFPTDYSTGRSAPNDAARRSRSANERLSLLQAVAGQYHENGYRFVPLVRDTMSLLCSLDILFLRRDIPGSVLTAGDLDNRIKTLIDALRKPKGANELRGNETPAAGEDPFFCLLEDDKSVSQFAVESDALLDPPTGDKEADRRQVRIVITVEIRPYHVTMFNLSFA